VSSAIVIGIVSLITLAVVIQLGLMLFTARLAGTVERRMPPPGHFADIGGARVHYVAKGDGPPIVLVHGLSGSTANFTYALFSRLRDRRLIAIDRPGSGYSVAPAGWTGSLTEQADVVAGLIRALGLEHPLIVGHSLGGAVALQLALDHPDQICGMVLIAPLTAEQGDVPPPFHKLAIRSAGVRRWFGCTLNVPASILQSKAALAWLFGPEEAPADFAIRGGGVLNLIPRNYRGAAVDLLAAETSIPALVRRLPELKCDVTVLFSPDDRILNAETHGRGLLKALPHARYLTSPGGHMLPVSQPDRVAAVITAFPMGA